MSWSEGGEFRILREPKVKIVQSTKVKIVQSTKGVVSPTQAQETGMQAFKDQGLLLDKGIGNKHGKQSLPPKHDR